MSSDILGSAPREQRGVASGILSTARGLGMVLGFSLGGSVFTAVLGGSAVGPTAEMVIQAADTTLLVAAGMATLAVIVLTTRLSIVSELVFVSGSLRRLARVAWSTSIRQA
jgi:hypothetical protein